MEQPDNSVLHSLGLATNPLITGLWQVADLERGGTELDRQQASAALLDYVNDGFQCFDMADHYGSAELIAGAARTQLLQADPGAAKQLKLYTKWCPKPDESSFNAVSRGIEARMERLGVDSIDLLQLHWWTFNHPGYIDVMDSLMRLRQQGWIKHIGVTNFDTDHLRVLLSCGFEIATNQVCLSVMDQRALGDMSELCQETGVRLLAYGVLAGGFVSERWLGAAEPDALPDWSKMKYHRFIQAAGGWSVFQQMLQTLQQIARRHEVSISNVAARWVIQQPAVAGVIVGARLTENVHTQSNRELLRFTLDDDDLRQIDESASRITPIPGDCGSEYRRPPYLTASGDLSHHLDSLPKVFKKEAVAGRANRWRINSGSEYEPVCGFSRAVRDGNRVLVSGTTATHSHSRPIGEDDLRTQAVYILDKIAASLDALGASLDDVIRTRIYMTDCDQWEVVSRVHGRYFANCLPANTLVEVSRLVGPYGVEIEAEALLEENAPAGG